MPHSLPHPKIIVALDYADKSAALALVDQLDPKLCCLKVGKEMFTRFGPEWVKQLINRNFSVFLDLKFHDIPHTVANACAAAADLGVWMLNVHTLGGLKMLQAANAAVAKVNPKPLLIGVTLLTSMSDADIHQIGLSGDISSNVKHLASLAQQANLDGVVCSAWEAPHLRQSCGQDFCLVTPGIRLAEDERGDQERIMTPEAAFAAGADYLVIGRPITQAAKPLEVLQKIIKKI